MNKNGHKKEFSRFNSKVKTRKIAVGLSKGGVAKTTTAVNLAFGLAEQNRRVLLIDTDVQAQCNLILGVTPELGLYDVINPDEGKKIAFEKAVCQIERQPKLDFLAGSLSLNYWEVKVRDRIAENPLNPLAQFEYLKNEISRIEDRYDYIIFDTAPGIVTLGYNVLFYATELLVPFALAGMTKDSLKSYLNTYDKLCDQRERFFKGEEALRLKYFLPTFGDRTRASSNAFEELSELIENLRRAGKHRDTFNQVRALSAIPQTTKLKELPDFGETIFEHAPLSAAAAAYGELVKEVLQDEQKIIRIRKKT